MVTSIAGHVVVDAFELDVAGSGRSCQRYLFARDTMIQQARIDPVNFRVQPNVYMGHLARRPSISGSYRDMETASERAPYGDTRPAEGNCAVLCRLMAVWRQLAKLRRGKKKRKESEDDREYVQD